jgi:hypothetical protein
VPIFPPDHNSQEIMAIGDDMPPRFRALVYEYGFVIVTYLMAEADDGIDADNLASEESGH